jgi:hypothetical protein
MLKTLVITPVFLKSTHDCRYVEELTASIQTQDTDTWHILVDDGSPLQGAEDFFREFCTRNRPTVSALLHRAPTGTGLSVRDGLLAAFGYRNRSWTILGDIPVGKFSWVSVVDHDDFFPTKSSVSSRIGDASNRTIAVHSDLDFYREPGSEAPRPEPIISNMKDASRMLAEMLWGHVHLKYPTLILRKPLAHSLAVDLNWDIRFGSDRLLGLAVVRAACHLNMRVDYVPIKTVTKRLHPDSITQSPWRTNIEFRIANDYAIYSQILDKDDLSKLLQLRKERYEWISKSMRDD